MFYFPLLSFPLILYLLFFRWCRPRRWGTLHSPVDMGASFRPQRYKKPGARLSFVVTDYMKIEGNQDLPYIINLRLDITYEVRRLFSFN